MTAPDPHHLCCSVRSLMIFLGFMITFSCYIQRTCLSVAIVAMTNYTHMEMMQAIEDRKNNYVGEASWNSSTIGLNVTEGCNQTGMLADERKEDGDLPFSKYQQGLVLGAYFWGYIALQIPGGRLAETWGARPVLSASMACAGISSLLTPVAARFNWIALLGTRVMLGLSTSVIFPTLLIFYSRWATPNERSRAISISFSGMSIGAAAIFPVTGVMCDVFGWDSVFYLVGCFSLLYSVVWWFLVASRPAMHRNISQKELKHIEHGQAVRGEHHGGGEAKKHQSTPWRQILTSVPILSLLLCHVTVIFGWNVVVSCLPLFMKEALHFDIKSNGVLSALPYVAFCIAAFLSSSLVDWLLIHQIVSRDVTRKTCSLIAGLGVSASYIGAGYTGCGQEWLAVLLVTIGQALGSLSNAGHVLAINDMAPQFSGSIFGLVNGAGNVMGIIVPAVISAMTVHKTREEWLAAFWLAGGIISFGVVQYLIFGSSKLQLWAAKAGEEEKPQLEKEQLIQQEMGKS